MYAHWILGSLRLLPSGQVSDLPGLWSLPLSYVALCHLPERRSGSHEWSPLSQALISSLTHTVSVFILALASIHPILPSSVGMQTSGPSACHVHAVGATLLPQVHCSDFLMHTNWNLNLDTYFVEPSAKWIWSPLFKILFSIKTVMESVQPSGTCLSLCTSRTFTKQAPIAVTLKITPVPHLPDLWPNLMGGKKSKESTCRMSHMIHFQMLWEKKKKL